MFYHIDDFLIYDTVRTTGNMDTTWLARKYQVNQSTPNNLRVQDWPAGRKGIGTVTVTTGSRSIYYPLGSHITSQRKNVNITMRLLNYVPNGVAIAGLSLVGPGQDDHILSFGFIDNKTGFVAYAGVDGVVRKDVFIMSTSLTGVQDVIEWGFEKSANDRNSYKPFILWVNNKAAYVQDAFCQIGSSTNLSARICGGVGIAPAGSTTATGFINLAGNVAIPICGVTDLIVNDGARNGLVRVVDRVGTVDLGPNSMSPNVSTPSHAELVGVAPPDANRYLVAATAAMEELYGAPAFPDLSSEAVLCMAIQVAGSKNNPYALELGATLRVSGQMEDIGGIPLDLSPGFATAIAEKNPVTGLSWTALEANSANFGLKVS